MTVCKKVIIPLLVVPSSQLYPLRTKSTDLYFKGPHVLLCSPFIPAVLFISIWTSIWVCCVISLSLKDKVHIPGAIYLSVKFDSRCYTEEGCDELIISSSSDFLQDVHNFSGSPQKWSDLEIPGEEYFKSYLSAQFSLFVILFKSRLSTCVSQVIPCTTNLCLTWATQSGATSSPLQEATEDASRQVLYIRTDTHTLLHLCKPASLPLVDDSALTSNWILRLSLSLFICLSLIRFWDTEANVSRWPSAQSLASGWHLGVAGGRGLSPDRKSAAQSHSLVAAAAAVSVPDVRVQSLLIHFCLFPSSSLQCFSHLM